MKFIAAVYAPMHEDQSLNLDMIDNYAPFLQSNGVHGAFVNGSTGDFVSLSDIERMQIVEKWSTMRSKSFEIINHVGHNSLQSAIKLAEHSKDLVDGIAVLPPFYFKIRKIEDLLFFCREVAKTAPSLPFFYYHIPILTGANFKMLDFMEMAVQHIPNFRGIKFTNNDFTDFQQCILFKEEVNKELELYFGIDEMMFNSIQLGGNGWVGSTYNHLAPLYQKIIHAYKQGDLKLAMQLQSQAVQFVTLLDGYGGFNGAAKSFMRTLGIDCGPSRFPHKTLSEIDVLEIKQKLEDIKITEACFSSMLKVT